MGRERGSFSPIAPLSSGGKGKDLRPATLQLPLCVEVIFLVAVEALP